MKSTSRPMSTDTIMRNLWLCLASDFRTVNGQSYALRQELNLMQGIKEYRRGGHPFRSQAPVYLFKQEYQLESLFKRYRFEDDVFTDEELTAQAVEKFLATQCRLGSSPLHVKTSTAMVLRRARQIARSILGEYNVDEHVENCRFGRRACVGTPYADSYLHRKVSTVTGSREHFAWFENHALPGDELLQELFSGANREICSKLVMTLVPKSFKALRSIMPDTLLGGFYTNGLGRMLEKRLRRHGLRISTLQKRHQILAKKFSVSRSHVTADLTAASDSITIELLCRVLPRDWYRALLYGRIPNIVLPTGETVRMITVLTMGLGQTFPLQTLLFYCLTKAVGELKGVNGVYSVYGDDLIYPTRIHREVESVFLDCKLLINRDKTYVEDHFRESCGGDYYHGVDVRPFQPEGNATLLKGARLHEFCCKLHNGLTRRWDTEEIPQTLRYIEWLLLDRGLPANRIPQTFPDNSGIINPINPTGHIKRTKKGYTFLYLRNVPDDVRVSRDSQLIYLWEKLRTMSAGPEEPSPFDDPRDNPTLRWSVEKHHGKDRLVAYVSSKTDARLMSQFGSVPWL